MIAAYDFHPASRLDLREIIDFIAEDNPAAAERVLAGILNTLEALARWPYLPAIAFPYGAKLPDSLCAR